MGSFLIACSCVPRTNGFIKRAATEDTIAMMAPTERSTPPVAITSVMPMDNAITGVLFRRISIRLPYR